MRIRATDRAGSPSESSIRFVSWSFRPQTASGGRGASPPDPRPAGCRRLNRRGHVDFSVSATMREILSRKISPEKRAAFLRSSAGRKQR
ncbi:hypothetical protein, partial [Victivallis sp.]|uniref:hypothetical protein n=1 Tax=Victivallis sp. TaxID=2049020 RepID=UPI003A904B52